MCIRDSDSAIGAIVRVEGFRERALFALLSEVGKILRERDQLGAFSCRTRHPVGDTLEVLIDIGLARELDGGDAHGKKVR